ncbi:hypothetical protein [Sphingobacterium alkalisoli]|uniref:hypothetical protein n=1 Tax=Sphingobacterium alkalisoli TaxID=1874115 RepID=UPI001B803F0E|nr:hypothetical protein [Sphingobacterium alkalisoli]
MMQFTTVFSDEKFVVSLIRQLSSTHSSDHTDQNQLRKYTTALSYPFSKIE